MAEYRSLSHTKWDCKYIRHYQKLKAVGLPYIKLF